MDKLDTTDIFGIVLVCGIVTIALLYLIGIGYLTTDIFNDKDPKDRSETQKNIIKMSLVLFWIGLLVQFIYSDNPILKFFKK
jgi:hypothetical protein